MIICKQHKNNKQTQKLALWLVKQMEANAGFDWFMCKIYVVEILETKVICYGIILCYSSWLEMIAF